jgi:pimeloyl-ACP methyl ester carboxylesterase
LEALRLLDLPRYNSFGDVDAALAERISDASLRQFLLKNLARDENGHLRWKIDLEAIERNYHKLLRGLAPVRTFDKPSLFIRGGRSNYIEDTDAPLIRQIFPQAEIATLAQAGHWVHVDLPEEFFQTVVNFLRRA